MLQYLLGKDAFDIQLDLDEIEKRAEILQKHRQDKTVLWTLDNAAGVFRISVIGRLTKEIYVSATAWEFLTMESASEAFNIFGKKSENLEEAKGIVCCCHFKHVAGMANEIKALLVNYTISSLVNLIFEYICFEYDETSLYSFTHPNEKIYFVD